MTNKINRRNLLKASAGLTGLLMSPSLLRGFDVNTLVETPPDETKHQSLSRHGNFKDSEVLLWSVMRVGDKSKFLNDVEVILNNYKYKSEITYRSNDKFKFGPSRSLINLVASSSSVEFSMYYMKDATGAFSDLSPSAYHSKLADVFQLFELFGEEANNLIAKSEGRYGPSDLMKDKISTAISGSIIPTNAKLDRILQVNNLISGLVYSFISETKTGNKIKLDLREHFDEKYLISNKNNVNFTIGNITVKRI